jgi:hypothetical protein
MPYGIDRLAEVLDVLAEVADTPELFNALSPAARAYLLTSPTLPAPEPAADLWTRKLAVFDAAGNVVSEILENPAIFNNLNPADREYLYEWFTGQTLTKD